MTSFFLSNSSGMRSWFWKGNLHGSRTTNQASELTPSKQNLQPNKHKPLGSRYQAPIAFPAMQRILPLGFRAPRSVSSLSPCFGLLGQESVGYGSYRVMDAILPRRKKCKYGNKILTYRFHRLYINIYIQEEKDFHRKWFILYVNLFFMLGLVLGFFCSPFFL